MPQKSLSGLGFTGCGKTVCTVIPRADVFSATHTPHGEPAHRLLALFGIYGLWAVLSVVLVLLSLENSFGFTCDSRSSVSPRTPESADIQYENARLGAGYTGSKICSKCHQSLYEQFVQTPMGRSMSDAAQSFQHERIPVPATVFDPEANQYIQVFRRASTVYMSIYGLTARGNVAFRHTEKLAYAIGSGANGVGYIIRRGNYLFQAPMAFYSRTRSWDLAPGYRQIDLGFSRAVTTACIICHSGLPRPVRNSTRGLYQDPPFQELAIGCERCHGPGRSHVEAHLSGERISANHDPTIVNPADLPIWLANDICMSCHQLKDAWVLKNGKDYTDFRPGTPLDDTVAIFAVPPQQGSPQRLPLLDHYFQMTLSKCFRDSGARLSCLTCHDPHFSPTPAQAPAYFRQKCLTCHTNRSCALSLELRRAQNPPNNCIGCHMPKSSVQKIIHSDVTNHRIVAREGEPYPSELPAENSSGLIYLDARPGTGRAPVAPLLLLQAYTHILSETPDVSFQERLSALVDQLAESESKSVVVLRLLAERAASKRTSAANQQAIGYLTQALAAGSTEPGDRLLLGDLLLREGHSREALRDAFYLMRSDRYNPLSYVLEASAYLAQANRDGAREVIGKGLQLYPENALLQKLLKRVNNQKLLLENVQ